jgi:hypothetical protein
MEIKNYLIVNTREFKYKKSKRIIYYIYIYINK